MAAPRTDGEGAAGPGGARGLAVFLVSAAVLGVQLLATRLFSVLLWHHLTYLVLTLTLLGFAASGTLLAVAPRLGRLGGDAATAVSLWSSLFGVTLLLAFGALAHDAVDTLDVESDRQRYFWLFLRYGYLVPPFLCAGLAVATALADRRGSVHATYFGNLLGSGLGCFLFVMAIRPLGGPACIGAFAGLAGLAGAAALGRARGGGPACARIVAVGTLLAGAAVTFVPALRPNIEPARSKSLTMLAKFYEALDDERRGRDATWPPRPTDLRRTVWGPLCRIDTIPVPPEPGDVARDRADPTHAPRAQVHLFQDGDAPTVVWSQAFAQERDPRASPYSLGYGLLRAPDVLVIGPGGGGDVATALAVGARSVTAVEINGDTLALMTGPLAGFTGGLFARPGVTVVHGEGRSFLRRQGDRRFDMVVMSGTDTYAALASGSYVFSESYLYTAEAFDDLFAHLTDAGILHVLRFRFEPPREELRLVATAAEALHRAGVRDPRANFLVVAQEDRQAQAALAALQPRAASDARAARLSAALAEFGRQPMRYGIVLARKRPFTRAEVETIAGALPALNGNPSVHHDLVYDAGTGVVPGAADNVHGRLLAAIAGDEAAAFYAGYRYRIEPATDDRPFFFDFYAWRDLLRPRSPGAAGYAALTGSEPIGLHVLAALLLQTVLATVLLVLLPLRHLPHRGGSGRGRALLHFASLGAGYFLVEIATLQRFVLYLGHPTWSLTVNLPAFLVFSGLGAFLAGRLGLGQRGAAVAAGAVVVLLAVHALWLPGFLASTLAAPESVRILLACTLTAPLALCMGMPFPIGLALVGGAAPGSVPAALGVNGATSVLASVLGILLAMEFGFTAVIGLAAVLYGVAMVTVPWVRG